MNVIDGFVTNWKAFDATRGIAGFLNATAAQIDLAARGAAGAMLSGGTGQQSRSVAWAGD